VKVFFFIVLAYLTGSIPTGLLLARIAGVDVRSAGSGNIGATNVARTAGRTLGVLTLLGDALKGLVPVLLARAFDLALAEVAAVAVTALVGHAFSVFLRFHGGKGVATGLGVLLGLAPSVVPIPLGIFVATAILWRIVSLSSVLASLSAPVALILFRYPPPTCMAGMLIAALILLRHRENISRLLAGTEEHFHSKK
jgi:acyl phosphate:glycerol-3-phosphate acyltransferase